MRKRSARSKLARRKMFGLPPVLEGEDAEACERLLDCAYRDIGPTDIITEFWAHDLVYTILES